MSLDNLTLPATEDLECLPGDITSDMSASFAEETLREFDHVVNAHDSEDPSVIALHMEHDSMISAI